MTTGERVRRRRGEAVAWAAIWLVVAGALVLPFVVTFTKLSAIDEYQHVDYLDKTLHLEHVNGGEKVGEYAMREQACRGTDLPNAIAPPCDAKVMSPDSFPGLGFNHTYADPPTYYVITGPLAKLAQAVTGVDSLVTAARGIGLLWLGAGLLATFVLCRRLGANQWAAAGATLLVASTPALLVASSTITTDAPELLVGAGLTLLALAVVQRRVSPWWLVAGGAVATAFKTTSLTALGMVGLFLLLEALQARRAERATVRERAVATAGPGAHAAPDEPVRGAPDRSGRGGAGRGWRGFLPVALLLAAGAVPLLAWTAFSSATSYSNVDEIPVAQMFKVDSIGWSQIAPSVKYLFSPVDESYMPPFMQTPSVLLALEVLNVLLIVGTAGLAWFGRAAESSTNLARAVFASMALGGPMLMVMLFVTEHVAYGIPGRYGLSMLPAAVGCVAVVASQRRGGGPTLVVLGVGAMAAFLAACA